MSFGRIITGKSLVYNVASSVISAGSYRQRDICGCIIGTYKHSHW